MIYMIQHAIGVLIESSRPPRFLDHLMGNVVHVGGNTGGGIRCIGASLILGMWTGYCLSNPKVDASSVTTAASTLYNAIIAPTVFIVDNWW